ncbi:hypothetical protein ACI2S5_17070 [Ralstonia nicotianae]|uniref:Uncharacterized protein n=1 Tax=Ralstonia solanacearum TaxID=305 RepID=A0ABY6NIQ9_RALSL|nr:MULTISPECIES: hypothetical protein [Ralstonia]QVX41514.1 hypothetical protein J4H89_19250 [Ralstonia solanacearum]UZF17180.1 hypothetical protein LH706_24750 [Ralstonia solanacearum]UZF23164.1 hypothetical protein LG939_21620 [Ralstonia solanacearum]UZF31938.1 hypothetical protein LGV82_22835 [Ralstonia sp. RS650]
MTLHELSHAKELLRVAEAMSIRVRLLTKEEGEAYILSVFDKFKPWKKEGHIAIGDDAGRLPTDTYEFSFSRLMVAAPAFVFFERSVINRRDVVVFEDARSVSSLMENNHGMEYFISDAVLSYLVTVNWYSIEYVGVELKPT